MLGKEPHVESELGQTDPPNQWSLSTTNGSGYFQSFRKRQPPPIPHKPPSLCSERVTRTSLTGSFVTVNTDYPITHHPCENYRVDDSHDAPDKTVTLQDVVKEHPGAQAVFPKGLGNESKWIIILLDHPDCSTILPQCG